MDSDEYNSDIDTLECALAVQGEEGRSREAEYKQEKGKKKEERRTLEAEEAAAHQASLKKEQEDADEFKTMRHKNASREDGNPAAPSSSLY